MFGARRFMPAWSSEGEAWCVCVARHAFTKEELLGLCLGVGIGIPSYGSSRSTGGGEQARTSDAGVTWSPTAGNDLVRFGGVGEAGAPGLSRRARAARCIG